MLNPIRLFGLKYASSSPSQRLSSTVVDPWRLKTSFNWFLPIQTRWKDNDQFAHVNNAVYHDYFDSVINVYLQRLVYVL